MSLLRDGQHLSQESRLEIRLDYRIPRRKTHVRHLVLVHFVPRIQLLISDLKFQFSEAFLAGLDGVFQGFSFPNQRQPTLQLPAIRRVDCELLLVLLPDLTDLIQADLILLNGTLDFLGCARQGLVTLPGNTVYFTVGPFGRR